MSNSAVTQGAPAKVSLKGSLIELIAVILLAASVGAAFEVLHPAMPQGGMKPEESATSAPSAGPSTIFDLPPIVTNLGAPGDTWIRFEGSIIFDANALPHPEAIADQISEDILAYLRTVSLRQLEGPIGLENIRQDLNERAAVRSGGKVQELAIRTLVVQ